MNRGRESGYQALRHLFGLHLDHFASGLAGVGGLEGLVLVFGQKVILSLSGADANISKRAQKLRYCKREQR